MKRKLDKERLEALKESLDEFEAASPYDSRELETSMEVLATQIFRLVANDNEPSSLTEAVETLPIDRHAKRQLLEICEEIQGALEVADYDNGDEEDRADSISNLKADFYWILEPELKKLQEAQ